jgi:hypothetical protein
VEEQKAARALEEQLMKEDDAPKYDAEDYQAKIDTVTTRGEIPKSTIVDDEPQEVETPEVATEEPKPDDEGGEGNP